MRFVLDASVLVPLFVADAMSDRTERWLSRFQNGLVVSDFASAEVSSAIARKTRKGEVTLEEARLAFSAFDIWTAIAAEMMEMSSIDMLETQRLVRLLGPPLRTPDALHVALTHRLGATLVTFDRQLANAARALSLPLADA